MWIVYQAVATAALMSCRVSYVSYAVAVWTAEAGSGTCCTPVVCCDHGGPATAGRDCCHGTVVCHALSEEVTQGPVLGPGAAAERMASQPPQSAPPHSSAPAAGQLKSALLLCATAAAAAAAAGGVAYWWLTCVAQPQSRQRRPRGRSKKSSSGMRTQSAATSGGQAAAARLQAQEQQQRGDTGASNSRQQQQLSKQAAGGPVAALQQAARVTGGGSSSSSAAASIESPFARQRAAVAAARGIKAPAAAAAGVGSDLGSIPEQAIGSGVAQLTSFADTLGVADTAGGSGAMYRSHNSDQHRSQHSLHSHNRTSLRSNSSAPELLLLSNR